MVLSKDAPLRNEWSNYSNWPYQDILPYNIQAPDASNSTPKVCDSLLVYPDTNIAGETNGIYYAGTYQAENQKEIMESWALIVDKNIEKNVLQAGSIELC